MKISVYDTVGCFHGITIFDEEGEILGRVQEFDTETFLCKLHGGKCIVAAGFALFATNAEHLDRILISLPDAYQHYIYPELTNEEEGNFMEARKAFVRQLLVHRKRLRSLTNK